MSISLLLVLNNYYTLVLQFFTQVRRPSANTEIFAPNWTVSCSASFFSSCFLWWPQGGVIGILIKWDCNLDWLMRRCLPRYSFRRLDEKESNRTLYPGLNFRWAGVKDQVYHIYRRFVCLRFSYMVAHFCWDENSQENVKNKPWQVFSR